MTDYSKILQDMENQGPGAYTPATVQQSYNTILQNMESPYVPRPQTQIPQVPVEPISVLGSIKRGMWDEPTTAIGQWIVNNTQSPQIANTANQLVKEEEQKYEQGRAAAGRSGIDLAKLGGNALTGLAVTPFAGTSLPAIIGSSVIGGGLMGALTPATGGGDFGTEKSNQILSSMALSALLPAAFKGAAGLAAPQIDKSMQILKDAGITSPIGQTLGGVVKGLEQGVASLPIVGNLIKATQRNPSIELNTGAANRVLAPISESVTKNVEPGYATVDYVKNKLSDAYNDLLPKLNIKADPQFAADMNNIEAQARENLPKEVFDELNDSIRRNVTNKFTSTSISPYGSLTGDEMKAMESTLGQLSSDAFKHKGNKILSADDSRKFASALDDTLDSIRSMVVRQNPQNGPELQNINNGWANFRVIQRASAMTKDPNGVYSPGELQAAAKFTDTSKNKALSSVGQSNMLDLANAAVAHLGATPASLPYIPGIRNVINTAITAQRPQIVTQGANLLRQAAPYSVPLLSPTAIDYNKGK